MNKYTLGTIIGAAALGLANQRHRLETEMYFKTLVFLFGDNSKKQIKDYLTDLYKV